MPPDRIISGGGAKRPVETTDAHFWDARFAESGYAYGTEPNDFLCAVLSDLPDRSRGGDALSLCEGEGRNAVFLARKVA